MAYEHALAEIGNVEGAGVFVEAEAGKAEMLERDARAGVEQPREQSLPAAMRTSIGLGIAGATTERRNLGTASHAGGNLTAQLAVQALRPGAKLASDERPGGASDGALAA